MQGEFGSKSLSGTVGGGRELRLTTTNGAIGLKKG
jgi:hypothetical protein